jgi:ATP-binding cassette subfamily C protein
MLSTLKDKLKISSLRQSIDLIGKDDLKQLRPYFWVQILLSFLDLVGIALIGFIGALAINGISSRPTEGKLQEVLVLANLDQFDFQIQVVILGVVATLSLLVKTFFSMWLTQKSLSTLSITGFNISKRLINQFFSRPSNVIEGTNSQILVHALTNGASLITLGVVSGLIFIFADLVLLAILFVALLIVNPLTTTTVFAFYGLTAYLLYRNTHKRATRAGTSEMKGNLSGSIKLIEGMSTYRELRLRGTLRQLENDLLKTRRNIAESQAELAFLPSVSKYVIEGALVVGAILVCGIQFLMSDAYSAIANLTLFLAAASRIAPAVLRIQNSIVQIKTSLTAIAPTLELHHGLALNENGSNWEEEKQGYPRKTEFTGKIEFKSVGFIHAGATNAILKDVSLSINPGEFVGIIGSSGVGKSTILDLIMGIRTPISGSVTIDGCSPQEIIAKFPGKISYVPQSTYITDSSIESNIKFGFDIHAAEDERLAISINESNLDELYSEVFSRESLGEGGKSLSGGERQRIGIARGLYTNPVMLLLDEPTSALDKRNAAQVSETILKQRGIVTIILITHDQESILSADRVFRLIDGELRELSEIEKRSL